MRLPALGAVLLLAACQPTPPAAAPALPGPSSIVFSQDAVGPRSLAGGAVVLDPGAPCPGSEVRVVGAGLPAGEVAITAPGPLAIGPVPVRADGSFDQRLRLPAESRGGDLTVRQGAASTSFSLPACRFTPSPGASRLPAYVP